ncbi:ARF GTPase activator (macronuclear) [Tetrahymena thermophila SB210]|uniref:ARF GTPase activator n=1 Tax=Tetrahymena thermophila (strain SB210) TaxID=312017 RepID=I7MLD0_TETTS|nr:ARF GTPase activator [Tetrahymena thermophila SB210]EAS01779.2 ARF GTPase activator [Tetrahymena thermophila SB210]|eukprot:XP_001022024.2 ARF GTPase activator [Tetrahymena thermophila SB210]
MSMAGEILSEVKQEKLFNILLKREENQICADCHTKAPTWVSLDFGVFVCMNCSGAHRHLSRSVTRVYSTKIDSWNHANYQIMDYVGNAIANSYWEFKKPPRRITFNAQPDERVRFVTEKYVRKLYCNPKAINPVTVFLKNREKGILERPVQDNQDEHYLDPKTQQIDEGKKKFKSNGPSTEEHKNQVIKEMKEQKQNGKQDFNSVTSPTCQPSKTADLLDFDDNMKLDNEDFTGFTSAPANLSNNQQQPQNAQQNPQININGNSLLDFYEKKQNSAPINGTQANSNGSNLNALYQNGNHYKQNSFPGYTNQYQPHMQQNLSNQVNPNANKTNYQLNGQLTQNQTGLINSNPQSNNNNSNTQQQQAQNKPVSLMELYQNNSNSSTNNNNIQNTQQFTAINQAFNTQVNANKNPNEVVVDKNKYQALNQMNQMGQVGQMGYQGYYPYYQMQQGYQNYNYQNQWKQQ